MAPENRPYFEERQAFAQVIYWLLVALCIAMSVTVIQTRLGWAMVSLPVIFVAMIGNLLSEETIVTGHDVRIRFGHLVPFYTRSIPLTEIETAEPAEYSPIREFGGWGIRGFGSNIALNARGNLGVRLELTRGRRVLIGSQRPNELAIAIREAKLGK